MRRRHRVPRALPRYTSPPSTSPFTWFLLNQLDIVENILRSGHPTFYSLNGLLRDVSRTFGTFEDLELKPVTNLTNFLIQFMFPPETQLETTRYTTYTRNHLYFWVPAFSRSFSRAVDMLFSIMALLGVTPNVAEFDADDRLHATIKLIRAMVCDGYPAYWPLTAPELPPSREFSLLPAFPETLVSGHAMLKTPHGRIPAFEAVARQEPWWVDGAPTSQMDDDGYFRVSAKAALVLPHSQSQAGPAEPEGDVGDVWAVVVGRRQRFDNRV